MNTSIICLQPSAMTLLGALVFVALAVLIGITMCKVMQRKGFRSNKAVVLTVAAVFSSVLVLRYGVSFTVFQGLFLMFVLLYASCSDLTTHEADDSLWIIVLALSLFSSYTVGLKSMLIGAFCVIVPQLAMAMLPPHKTLGGADIKLSSSLAFLLGAWRGIGAYLIGLILAVVYMAIYNKVKNRDGKEAFALIPFLSASALAMFII